MSSLFFFLFSLPFRHSLSSILHSYHPIRIICIAFSQPTFLFEHFFFLLLHPSTSQVFTSFFAPILPRYPYSISLPLLFLVPCLLMARGKSFSAGAGRDVRRLGDSTQPRPDQKKARRVKRRRGPRRTRLGPSPNVTETKDDTQRLYKRETRGLGGRRWCGKTL